MISFDEDNLIQIGKNSENKQSLESSEGPQLINQLPQKKTSNSNPKITKISAQKKAHRFNIFLNHRFAFGISEDLLVKYELHKGMEMTPALQKQLLNDEKIQKAYHQALNYLGYRQRSTEEVREYLLDHGFDTEIEPVIQKLLKLKLLNDQFFADSYVRTAVSGGKKGTKRIERELTNKGIAPEKIMNALDNHYSPDQQIENALALAKKKWGSLRNKSEREGLQKINHYLSQRGFSKEIIRQLETVFQPEMNPEEEYDHLKTVADKAWRRYSRRTEGYERDQKVKAFLYRKQFPKTLIDRYMNEKKLEEDG